MAEKIPLVMPNNYKKKKKSAVGGEGKGEKREREKGWRGGW